MFFFVRNFLFFRWIVLFFGFIEILCMFRFCIIKEGFVGLFVLLGLFIIGGIVLWLWGGVFGNLGYEVLV